jgi:hypothetical protein
MILCPTQFAAHKNLKHPTHDSVAYTWPGWWPQVTLSSRLAMLATVQVGRQLTADTHAPGLVHSAPSVARENYESGRETYLERSKPVTASFYHP